MSFTKTIKIDPCALLAAIQAAYRQAQSAAESAAEAASAAAAAERGKNIIASAAAREAKNELAIVTEYGIRLDFVQLLARPLTPTMRLYAQQAIRDLVAAGRLTRTGHRIRPTTDIDTDAAAATATEHPAPAGH